MKKLLSVLLLAAAPSAFAQVDAVTFKVPAGFHPSLGTAHALCKRKGYNRSVGFTQFKQAGDKIGGQYSPDGTTLQPFDWGGGMAIATISCTSQVAQQPVPQSRPSQPVPVPQPAPSPNGVVKVNINGGYYPDENTAHALCRMKGYDSSVGFTQFRQAGNWIRGQISYDGRPFFDTYDWSGGMAIAVVSCLPIRQPVNVNARGGYYPDQDTADAVCRLKGYNQAVGFTQWQQAGNRIRGQRSFDGRPFFSTYDWSGGMALDVVSCL
ncbi:MAG: hypothetical protein A4S09_13970 [Proteobacteria bacterium SG_bin7]|nr:MAG: hypothetical protein A4S09_13970 [Proteobacteria bacterium SG_bin7]